MTSVRHVRHPRIRCLAVAVLMALPARVAAAPDPDRPSAFRDIVKQVVLDPTTYAPAVLAYEAHHLDWKSSQVFFQHGFLEHNGEFTVSGGADDTPVSYGVGNRRIVATGFRVLRTSLIHNVSGAVIEHVLTDRFPNHRKLVRTAGWIERIAFASYVAYRESAAHFRQWQHNEDLARQLGYK